ncbi:MAG: aldo/keto reductase [Eubacteriaceae bacterium]|nr:aldo/keto reductase [Eubacteriaceae bacterium]
MKYRHFNGKDISQLGFGAMRLPTLENGEINKEESFRLFKYAFDEGVNYYDTAYVYHGGKSEVVLGEWVKNEGIRDKVYIADKLPTLQLNDDFDANAIFAEQLERLDTDYIDFYLMHALSLDKWNKLKELGIIKFMDEIRAKGKVKYIGFSFHDDYDAFVKIIDDYDWQFCQIQLNFMDIEIQAGIKGLEYAASKGIPVTIMEPLKGGKITQIKDPYTTKLKNAYKLQDVPTATICLNFLFDRPEVLTVLSGMNVYDHVVENIKAASNCQPGAQSEAEKRFLTDLRDYINGKATIPCTACRYCVDGCPNSINIPRIFDMYNDAVMYDTFERNKAGYDRMPSTGKDCAECGQCEDACPQHLTIMDYLKKVDEYFSANSPVAD